MERTTRLGEFERGMKGRIVRVGDSAPSELVLRMLAMGLHEGAEVELVHEAPFSGDPVAVRVRGALIALRRSEANLIEVVVHGRAR